MSNDLPMCDEPGCDQIATFRVERSASAAHSCVQHVGVLVETDHVTVRRILWQAETLPAGHGEGRHE